MVKEKIFYKFTIGDIVFLAVLTAVLFLSCGVMPAVKDFTHTIYGIAQMVTGFQLGLFITIGTMKIRKIGTVTLIALLMGSIMVLMAPIMIFSNLFFAFIIDWIMALIIFKGYKKDLACFFAGALAAPLSLPVHMVWNYFAAPDIFAALTSNLYLVIGATFVVFAVSALGAFVGLKIAKELRKAGALKENKLDRLNES